MKVFTEVSAEKLRGGFYTPSSLVHICLNRIESLRGTSSDLTVLEPSVGDGVFLRHLAHHELAKHISRFVGVEIVKEEAEKCRSCSHNVSFDVQIHNESVLKWIHWRSEEFDVAIGNPPFVRFQFVSESDVAYADAIGKAAGIALKKVSNLWIPILIGTLHKLRIGGIMAFVVPAEIFTGISAGDIRAWLLHHFRDLQIDMFAPGSFPDVLQEVVIISGRKNALRDSSYPSIVSFTEHSKTSSTFSYQHTIAPGNQTWTKYLLTPRQLQAFDTASHLPRVSYLGMAAKMEVSIVTGANDFFSVSSADVQRYDLHKWIEPLLPRIRYATGLIFTKKDHDRLIDNGNTAWLLNFNENRLDPMKNRLASEYLALGEKQGLQDRYKTSIRKPWYRVPSVWAGNLMLSKRSHLFPRLVYNLAGAVTTDTIYRGQMVPEFAGKETDLVAVFHNSLTLLTAELEGRSFGGGVLELVPSEIYRLLIPFPVRLGQYIDQLDDITRETSSQTQQEQLIYRTNQLLSKHMPGFTKRLFTLLEEARENLMQRRLARN